MLELGDIKTLKVSELTELVAEKGWELPAGKRLKKQELREFILDQSYMETQAAGLVALANLSIE